MNLAKWAFALALSASTAFAQQSVLLNGADSSTNDAGIIRRVAVDSQGRLMVTLPADGGVTINASSATTTAVCGTTSQTVTSVGVAASSLPVLASRWYARVCNSAENSGSPIVKCRDDGVNPTMGIANAGEALNNGDCVTYFVTAAVRCISDTAATAVTQSECKQ